MQEIFTSFEGSQSTERMNAFVRSLMVYGNFQVLAGSRLDSKLCTARAELMTRRDVLTSRSKLSLRQALQAAESREGLTLLAPCTRKQQRVQDEIIKWGFDHLRPHQVFVLPDSSMPICWSSITSQHHVHNISFTKGFQVPLMEPHVFLKQ